MILWRDYLARLAEDGVSLGEAEEEALTETGERATAYFLSRLVGGRLLYFTLPGPVILDDPVPRYLRRQIANVLRLPPEKYVFPEQ